MRSQSTLPGFTTTTHFDSLKPPSPRQMHSRSSGRPNNASLKLPSLPRFHPANYPPSHGSPQTTPEGTSGSPQPPPSPRARQRMYSDAQMQLFHYQREMVSHASRSNSPGRGKPASPRLAPLGSPGPVTPLELEGEEGYLVAGVRGATNGSTTTESLVDSLIQTESRRQQRSPPRSSSGR